jgi:hypothetical protein
MAAKKYPELKVKRKRKKFRGYFTRNNPPSYSRATRIALSKIIQRIVDLPDTAAEIFLPNNADFSERHKDIGRVFERHLNEVKDYVPLDAVLSDDEKGSHRGLFYNGVLH